ncbi:tyrosine-protein phosphatase, partial [bacterium]|nr:tyrosine-protein phosphatase [bacterium]
MKKSMLLLGTTLVCLVLFLVAIKIRSLRYDDDGPGLAVRWEGFYHDYNFRDVGISLNECLGERVFRPGVLMRAAGWFSGWSCDGVGNPDTIFSLNYSPEKTERYFCQGAEGKTIGRFYNTQIKLNDLEFPATWEDERMRSSVCGFIGGIFREMVAGKKTLIHCDAGRDRTGAITALIAALVAEESRMLDSRMLAAIECDYRKTASLDEQKHGRMKQFITDLQTQGGVAAFLQNQC